MKSEVGFLSEFGSKTESLCPPCRNLVSDFNFNIEDINARIDNCGLDTREFLSVNKLDFVEFTVYCDNRACLNPACMEHRGYKFRKAHSEQIGLLNGNMREPKAWLFTGWRLSAVKFTRDFINSKFRRLFLICRKYSISEFSIHMEFKLNLDGSFYLHFHVVSAGFRELGLVYRVWRRVIRYEEAIKPEALAVYVSKYASKVPKGLSLVNRDIYLSLVYKIRMHRFSPRLVKNLPDFVNSIYDNKNYVKWITPAVLDIWARTRRREYREKKPPPNYYLVENLEREIYDSLFGDSYLNPYKNKRGIKNQYHPFLEDKKRYRVSKLPDSEEVSKFYDCNYEEDE